MSVDLGSEFMTFAIAKPGIPMEIAVTWFSLIVVRHVHTEGGNLDLGFSCSISKFDHF